MNCSPPAAYPRRRLAGALATTLGMDRTGNDLASDLGAQIVLRNAIIHFDYEQNHSSNLRSGPALPGTLPVDSLWGRRPGLRSSDGCERHRPERWRMTPRVIAYCDDLVEGLPHKLVRRLRAASGDVDPDLGHRRHRIRIEAGGTGTGTE